MAIPTVKGIQPNPINKIHQNVLYAYYTYYRGAHKVLSPTRMKKQLKGRHFSSDAEVTAARETWLDGQPSELCMSGLKNLDFGRCSLFPFWLG
jgi:hypothetical protein